MLRQLVVSFSAQVRLDYAAQWLGRTSKEGEVLLVASSRGAADDLVRALGAQKGALMGIHRLSLAQLASLLATDLMAREGRIPVSGLAVEALVARSVHLCRQQGSLEYFSPVSAYPGFTRAAASTLMELALQEIRPDQLSAVGPAPRDLGILLECYRQQLAKRSLVDLPWLFQAARQVLEQAGHRFARIPVLLLEVTPASSLEKKLLQALVRGAPQVMATALRSDEENVKLLERLLETTARVLDEAKRAPTSLGRVREFVFLLKEIPESPRDESLRFFSAPGEGSECVEMARRIRFAAEAGVPFDQMAILLRNVEGYLPVLEDALRRAGVPAYFTRGTRRPEPAGRAFLALLACAAEGLSASRFAEYLSLGQVPLVDESGGPPLREIAWVAPSDEGSQLTFKTPEPVGTTVEGGQEDGEESQESPVLAGTLRVPFHWERLLVEAAVIGGKERWARRLQGLENEFRVKLRELEGEDEQYRRALESQLERLGNLRRFALPVIGLLDSLPRSALWGEWLDVLKKLAGRVLKRADPVLSVLNELQPMEGVGPVGLNEVREVLSQRLSLLRTEPPPQRYGRVFVGTLAEAVGRSFEIVFLPGLAEGIFPRKITEDPLLLDADRKQVSPALESREVKARRERLLLRIAAGATHSQLVVSYPRMDVGQGRPRVPSFYALDILRAAEGRLSNLRQLEKGAAVASDTRLGWPAPKHPRDAVDDAEYDLAVVADLLRRPETQVEGHARYLLSVNQHLARSLRSRARRWRSSWSEADGLVEPDFRTLDILKAHRLRARPYSPTALQNFAVCPYRFFLSAIHRLEPRQAAVAIEQMDPLTRGSLFHQVQCQLLRELRNEGLLPMTEEHFSRIMDRADEVLNRVASSYQEELAPAIPRIWNMEVEDLRTDLRGWILQVVQSGREWRPLHFEFSFGLPFEPHRDPQSTSSEALILDGIALRGAIDLIEEHKENGRLRVVDHKTGKAPKEVPRLLGGGESLQPLLYALAAEDLLKRQVEAGELFFCTQRGNYQRVTIRLTEEARERMRAALRMIDEHVKNGFLPAAPREKACDFCDYRVVCGPYEELRVKRKQPDRLTQLMTLRSTR